MYDWASVVRGYYREHGYAQERPFLVVSAQLPQRVDGGVQRFYRQGETTIVTLVNIPSRRGGPAKYPPALQVTGRSSTKIADVLSWGRVAYRYDANFRPDSGRPQAFVPKDWELLQLVLEMLVTRRAAMDGLVPVVARPRMPKWYVGYAPGLVLPELADVIPAGAPGNNTGMDLVPASVHHRLPEAVKVTAVADWEDWQGLVGRDVVLPDVATVVAPNTTRNVAKRIGVPMPPNDEWESDALAQVIEATQAAVLRDYGLRINQDTAMNIIEQPDQPWETVLPLSAAVRSGVSHAADAYGVRVPEGVDLQQLHTAAGRGDRTVPAPASPKVQVFRAPRGTTVFEGDYVLDCGL